MSWGLLKPRQVTGPISRIICCAFYSPPNSKKKTKLIEHLSSVLQDLLLDHTSAAVIISGDRNDLSINRLLSVDPNLRQIVKHFTHGTKILDVILTNIGMFYNEPIIVDPIPVDDPTKGVPSDHRGVVVNPIVDAAHPPQRTKRTKVFRIMPDSLINKFGEKICNMSWDFLTSELSSTELTEQFQSTMSLMIDNSFPQKTMTMTDSDQPWVTQDLKRLKRVRSREFCRHGRSPRYARLKNEFEVKETDAVKKYTDKIIEEVRNGSKSSCYKALRKLGVRAGDVKDEIFTLPEHIKKNLSEQESVEQIADYFSNISQEYEPLNIEDLPPNVRHAILSAKDDPDIPILEPHEVYEKIMKTKKPASILKGDIPKKLVQLFAPEMALPVSKIYNKITKTAEYPRQWVEESQFPIGKVHPPSSEDDLRPISKTFFYSKVYESFIGEWLLPIIRPFMDPGQYGIKGSSIVHYLIKFLHFIHSTLDLKQPHAVLNTKIVGNNLLVG